MLGGQHRKLGLVAYVLFVFRPFAVWNREDAPADCQSGGPDSLGNQEHTQRATEGASLQVSASLP